MEEPAKLVSTSPMLILLPFPKGGSTVLLSLQSPERQTLS